MSLSDPSGASICTWEQIEIRSESKGDTESEAGSRLQAVSTKPPKGLKLTDWDIMTWAEVGRSTNWATQASLPVIFSFN